MQSRKGKGLHALLQELSNNEEATLVDPGLDVPDDPQWPWLHDYHDMDILEQVPDGCMSIQWWGISITVSISCKKTNMIS